MTTTLLIFATTTLIALVWVTYESGHPNPTRGYRAIARAWNAMEGVVARACDRFWALMPRRKPS